MIPVTRRFTLRGDCMLPLLEPGDVVWVRRDAAPSPRGPLVAYARFNGPLPEIAVHRLLADGRTRADARLRPDPPDESAAPVGRVVAVSRGGRTVRVDSARGRAWDAFCRLYARAVMASFRERVLNPLEESGYAGTRSALRGAALAAPRAVFRLLFGRPA